MTPLDKEARILKHSRYVEFDVDINKLGVPYWLDSGGCDQCWNKFSLFA